MRSSSSRRLRTFRGLTVRRSGSAGTITAVCDVYVGLLLIGFVPGGELLGDERHRSDPCEEEEGRRCCGTVTAVEQVEGHPAVDETAKHFDLGCDDGIRSLHHHHWEGPLRCVYCVWSGVWFFRWFWVKTKRR